MKQRRGYERVIAGLRGELGIEHEKQARIRTVLSIGQFRLVRVREG